MAVTPETFKEFQAEVVSIKGTCGAGHKEGDRFRLSCWNADGLCGFFYHDLFPYLSALQFGGTIPWAQDGPLTLECPDRHNLVTLVLRPM